MYFAEDCSKIQDGAGKAYIALYIIMLMSIKCCLLRCGRYGGFGIAMVGTRISSAGFPPARE